MSRFYLFLLLALTALSPCKAQTLIGSKEVPDIDYASPREYEIDNIIISGTQFMDPNVVISFTGLKKGDRIQVPGDAITRAIENLWKQGLFADIKVYAAKVQGPLIDIEFRLLEKPRLSRSTFTGIKKSDKEKLNEKLNLTLGQIVTENLIRTVKHKIRDYFLEDGFLNTEVNVGTLPDTLLPNSVRMIINVNMGKRVKIEDIIIHGNDKMDDRKLERAMKDTKERGRIDFLNRIYNKFSSFDSLKTINLRRTLLALHPLNLPQTFSDNIRLRIFSTSKLLDDAYESDKQKIIEKYNDKGFRDAKIVKDTFYFISPHRINLEITVDEGRKYYFGNITWAGNAKYKSQDLNKILDIKRGDIYSQEILDKRLYMNPNGNDISSLYLDNGYLFFQVIPVETSVNNDTIDLEMRVYEGKQATINRVSLVGNTKTNDRVIMREIRTKPGELFSRSDIIRSQRELAQLGYFDPEKLNVNPKPNPADGTVDIEYVVEEKPSDQLELSGGWGAGQLVGTLGVSFNNFSTRNFFRKESWRPLPSGDGQKLSVRAQSSGLFFQSYNMSFTEPWLGGKKPNSLSVSLFRSIQSNGLKKSDSGRESIRISGVAVGFGKRLKVPDDFFTNYFEVNLQHYELNNFNSTFLFNNGFSYNFNIRNTLSRNSIDRPIYSFDGSQISFTVQATPPFSLFNKKDYSTLDNQAKYKWIEYHKWNFKASWFTRLGNTKMVINSRLAYGFLGFYNNDIGQSPFERFYVGGDGLSGFSLDGREIIALRGYDNNSLTPQSATGNYIGGTIFDKYTLELRYPLSLNPQATIFVLGFVEGGNAWLKFKEFNPFEVKRSAGIGIRIALPMFGLLGLDYGWGFDDIPNRPRLPGERGQLHFSIGGSIE